ncbi:MAG: hypothetical protein IT428_03925 [Planctomycetaceae bacterium]|nr:hypothetical protein [Planctomycetaceae bacterium]
MLADDHVDKVGHDGAGIARVTSLVNDFSEGLAYEADLFVGEREEFVFQQRPGAFLKLADRPTRRLMPLAAKMQFSQILQHVGAHLARVAAARIIGEPPAVCGPDEMVGGDVSHDMSSQQCHFNPKAMRTRKRGSARF